MAGLTKELANSDLQNILVRVFKIVALNSRVLKPVHLEVFIWSLGLELSGSQS